MYPGISEEETGGVFRQGLQCEGWFVRVVCPTGSADLVNIKESVLQYYQRKSYSVTVVAPN